MSDDILESFSIEELDGDSIKENNNKNLNNNQDNKNNESDLIKEDINSEKISNNKAKDNYKEIDTLNDKMLEINNNNNIKNSNKIEDNHIYYMEDDNSKKKLENVNKSNTNDNNEYDDFNDFNNDILTEEDKDIASNKSKSSNILPLLEDQLIYNNNENNNKNNNNKADDNIFETVIESKNSKNKIDYVDTFGNKKIDTKKNILSWLDEGNNVNNNDNGITTNKNMNENVILEEKNNLNNNNNISMEDKEIQVKIPKSKPKLKPIENKVEEKKIENNEPKISTPPKTLQIKITQKTEEPKIEEEKPAISLNYNEIKKEDNNKIKKENSKINTDNNTQTIQKITLKSCIPEEYYELPLKNKYYYLKKLFTDISKKSNESKSKASILQSKYNFEEIYKEMNKVQIELISINKEKNKQALDQNQKLIKEINLIHKKIQLKSKKIKNIQSSNDYINRIINSNNSQSIVNLQNELKSKIENLRKVREEYIQIIKDIETNKEMVNKNEEELLSLRDRKSAYMEINYKYEKMKEENVDLKKNLKILREKFKTVMGSDEDNKIIYNSAISELDLEIQNKLKKIEELKIELEKEKEKDDKTQEEINKIYNKFKLNENNIKINDDMFKFLFDNTNNNKSTNAKENNNKKKNIEIKKNDKNKTSNYNDINLGNNKNINADSKLKENKINNAQKEEHILNNNINNNINKNINNNLSNNINNNISSNISSNFENGGNEQDSSSNKRKPKFTISFKKDETKIKSLSTNNDQNTKIQKNNLKKEISSQGEQADFPSIDEEKEENEKDNNINKDIDKKIEENKEKDKKNKVSFPEFSFNSNRRNKNNYSMDVNNTSNLQNENNIHEEINQEIKKEENEVKLNGLPTLDDKLKSDNKSNLFDEINKKDEVKKNTNNNFGNDNNDNENNSDENNKNNSPINLINNFDVDEKDGIDDYEDLEEFVI